MTTIFDGMNLPPLDLTPFRERYGQIPTWDTGVQELVYWCPQCEHVYRWRHRMSQRERTERVDDPGFLLAYEADVTKIPKVMCPMCSFMRFEVNFRVAERISPEGTVSYLYEYIGRPDNILAHDIMQVRRLDISPRMSDTDLRWPFSRMSIWWLNRWLMYGVRDADDSDHKNQLIHSKEPSNYTPFGPEEIAKIAYDVYDGLTPTSPLRTWVGGAYRVECGKNIFGPETYPVSLTLLSTQEEGEIVTRTKIANRWQMHAGEFSHYFGEYQEF